MKSEIMMYYEILNESHSDWCECELRINWNIEAISNNKNANGYIVQEFQRTIVPKNVLGSQQFDNIHYFEAWCVKDGLIVPEDNGCNGNDVFSIGQAISLGLPDYDLIRKSINTKACFEFRGRVYWIPIHSQLYNKVDCWKTDEVKQTGGLKGTWYFPDIRIINPVFEREIFTHSWDLIDEDNIFITIKNLLFSSNYSQKNELMEDLQYIFDGQFKHIVDRIIKEWEER